MTHENPAPNLRDFETLLEPESTQPDKDFSSAQTWALVSIAISLRRLADMMYEKTRVI
jgi:hypothetical protein